jgi:hypothetical protein
MWQINYDHGTKYELYRVVLEKNKFEGRKFKDVCMILYIRLGFMLIAIEKQIGDQIRVFVNPYDYIFEA